MQLKWMMDKEPIKLATEKATVLLACPHEAHIRIHIQYGTHMGLIKRLWVCWHNKEK